MSSSTQAHAAQPGRKLHTAIFEDIGIVAREERERIFGAEPEPMDVQMLRLQAANDAQKVVTDAITEAEVIREDARQEGYRRGFAEGFDAGRSTGLVGAEEERARYRRDFEALITRIEEERRRIWNEAEGQIIEFVLEIAQKVVKDDVSINRQIAISTIRNALRRITDHSRICVRVHIDDLETVRAFREDLTALVDGVGHIEIVEDRRVSPGGCVVETVGGTIDARIETQFTEIESLLTHMTEKAA